MACAKVFLLKRNTFQATRRSPRKDNTRRKYPSRVLMEVEGRQGGVQKSCYTQSNELVHGVLSDIALLCFGNSLALGL